MTAALSVVALILLAFGFKEERLTVPNKAQEEQINDFQEDDLKSNLEPLFSQAHKDKLKTALAAN